MKEQHNLMCLSILILVACCRLSLAQNDISSMNEHNIQFDQRIDDNPKVKLWLNNYYQDELKYFRHHRVDATLDFYDINSDGKQDLFVYGIDRSCCGTAGCCTDIFIKKTENWEEVFSGHTYGANNIQVLKSKTGGYNDLNIKGDGNHSFCNSLFKWSFDEKRYRYVGKPWKEKYAHFDGCKSDE